MEDRVATIAKLVAEFNGTLVSAEEIVNKITEIRKGIRLELVALTKELNAIDGLSEYLLAKRNELAHDVKPHVVEHLVMSTKGERVEAVTDAALALVRDGIPIFGIEDIQHQFGKMRVELGVSYPPAVIATILTADKRFKKSSTGFYEYSRREQKKELK